MVMRLCHVRSLWQIYCLRKDRKRSERALKHTQKSIVSSTDSSNAAIRKEYANPVTLCQMSTVTPSYRQSSCHKKFDV
jgi:hypothetical protein